MTLTLLALGGIAAFATHAHAEDSKGSGRATPDFGLRGSATVEGGTTGNAG